MIPHQEQLQILYDIAMDIGGSTDLDEMLERSLQTVQSKLDCLGLVVIREVIDEKDSDFKIVYHTPDGISKHPAFHKAIAHVISSGSIERGVLTKIQATPHAVANIYQYHFDLPGFGYLILLKDQPSEEEFCHSLIPVFKRLADACIACETTQELIDSRENLSITLNSIGDAVIVTDLQGSVVSMNPVAEKLTGWPESQAKGMKIESVFLLYDSETGQRIRCSVQHVLAKNQNYALASHAILTSRNGTQRHVADSASPILDETGGIKGVVQVIRDVTEEDSIREVLKESEERQRYLLDNAPSVIYIKDIEGKYLFINRKYEELFGVKNEDFVGKTDREIFDSAKAEELIANDKKVIESGHPIEFEELVPSDGVEHTYISIKFPLKDSDGTTYALCGISTDITQMKGWQEELRSSKQMLQQVMDNIPQFVFWKDKDLVYQGCNQNFANAAGVGDVSNIVGKTDYDLAWKKEEADFFREVDKRVMGTNTPELHIIEPQQQADGKQAWLDTNKVPLRDREGNVTGILGTYEDITERILAEEALKASELKFRSIIEQSEDAIYIVYDNKIDMANERFKELTGIDITKSDDHRSLFMSCLSEKSLSLFREREDRLKNGEHVPKLFEFDLRNLQNGKLYYLQASASIIQYKEKQARLGILRDITPQKKLEEQLRHIQKIESIGQLAGGIAHDFNNLLTPIIGSAELGQMDSKPGEPFYEYFNEIKQMAEKAGDLTRQLLAFSRKQVLEVKTVDLNKLIVDLHRMLDRTTREDIKLKFTLSSSSISINADPSQVEQILLNLIVNAQDAMPDGGIISIESKIVHLDEDYTTRHAGVEPGSYSKVTVSDTGVGMDEATQKKIFEPFFTTKDPGKGTGLGLATVYGIIRQHQGHIWVYSEPGKGTAFHIYFPLAENENQQYESSSGTKSLKGTESVLIVEDQPQVREISRQILELQGYTVTTVGSGEESLELIPQEAQKIDLLLTDLVLPGINGRDLFDKLVMVNPRLKVLYMSGYTQDVISHHGILDEGIHFIQKPLTIDSLSRKVREVLDS